MERADLLLLLGQGFTEIKIMRERGESKALSLSGQQNMSLKKIKSRSLLRHLYYMFMAPRHKLRISSITNKCNKTCDSNPKTKKTLIGIFFFFNVSISTYIHHRRKRAFAGLIFFFLFSFFTACVLKFRSGFLVLVFLDICP